MSKNKITTGLCKLCLKDAELKRSHIIPKKYFNKIRDQNGAYFEVSASGSRTYNYDYKERLLCGGCEKLLNENYEKYGNHMFETPQPYRHGSELRIVNYNHDKAYLYFWSIFWRASVSSHEIFKDIRDIFPPLLREEVRRALLLGRIPTIIQFGRLDKVVKLRIFKIEIKGVNRVFEQVISQPSTSRNGMCLMLLGYLIEISFDKNQNGRALSRMSSRVDVVGEEFILSHKYLRAVIVESKLGNIRLET